MVMMFIFRTGHQEECLHATATSMQTAWNAANVSVTPAKMWSQKKKHILNNFHAFGLY